MRAVNSATGLARFGLALEVCDAIIASAFISYPFVHIVQIGFVMKDEQRLRLSAQFGSSSGCILTHPVGDDVFDKPITFVSAWALLIAEMFDRVGIETEVIGYTTRAWKGGQSREKWLTEGRPERPGRLNDIRYIVYKSFETSFLSSIQNFGTMLKEGLLKENIDGEALLYSMNSIKNRDKQKKIILIISDGAPVDDSTLSVNDESYLSDHLKSVIAQIKETEIEIMSVGVDFDVSRYYGENGIASEAEDVGLNIFEIMKKMLLEK